MCRYFVPSYLNRRTLQKQDFENLTSQRRKGQRDFGKIAILNKKEGPGLAVALFFSSRSRVSANPLA